MVQTCDLIVIGGGIMGASISYNLANDGFDGKIFVFEKDRAYTYSSTTLSAAGVRELFSQPISIKMANYNIDVLERFEEEMAVDGERPHIDFIQNGQMIVADAENFPLLEKQARLQQELGARVDILSPADIQRIIPEINIEGIAGATISRRGGKLDAYGLLQGYVKKGKSLGVNYVYEEVTKISKNDQTIVELETSAGNKYSAPVVVLAAGPWSAEVGKMMGIDLPVKPLRRMIHVIKPQEAFCQHCPKIFFGTGPSITPETGGSFLITRRKGDEQYGFNFKVDYRFFPEIVWPEIAERIPALETLKLMREWAGLYSVCTWDSNEILGKHPKIDNLYLAIGFSGHGLQQAPSVGKGLSELIRDGAYDTIDLTPFRFERKQENDLIEEVGLAGTFEYEKG
jgi:glycine/D-amino acid oxidase-like deaminating enzyme